MYLEGRVVLTEVGVELGRGETCGGIVDGVRGVGGVGAEVGDVGCAVGSVEGSLTEVSIGT
jgi:hypothetical protein